MALAWEVSRRTAEHVLLVRDGATLLIEVPRPHHCDLELSAAIGRLAPHVTFGPPSVCDDRTERVGSAAGERVVIGHILRRGWCMAYLLAAHGSTIDIDDVLQEYLPTAPTAFAHLAD